MVAVTLVGAFLLGGHLGGGNESPGAMSERAPGSPQAVAQPAACDDDGLRARVRELEQHLRSRAPGPVSIPSGAAGPVRPRTEACTSPAPIVEDVAPHRTAEEFRAAASKALEECNTGLSLQEVDCSELPCIAWALGDAARAGSLDLDECGSWRSNVARREMITAKAMGAGGDLYFALMPVPLEGDVSGIVRKYPERIRVLAESWGESRSAGPR